MFNARKLLRRDFHASQYRLAYLVCKLVLTRPSQLLAHSPFSFRKVGDNPFVRELIIPFGGTGYVAMFEIRDNKQVIICAVRHQYESDYH